MKNIDLLNTENRPADKSPDGNAATSSPQAKRTVIDDNLSKRINSLRFLLIVGVVFIHNNPVQIQFRGGRKSTSSLNTLMS